MPGGGGGGSGGGDSDGNSGGQGGATAVWQPGWRKVTRTSRSLKSVVDGGRSPPHRAAASRRCGLVRTEGCRGTQPPERRRDLRGSGEEERDTRTMVVSRARGLYRRTSSAFPFVHLS